MRGETAQKDKPKRFGTLRAPSGATGRTGAGFQLSREGQRHCQSQPAHRRDHCQAGDQDFVDQSSVVHSISTSGNVMPSNVRPRRLRRGFICGAHDCSCSLMAVVSVHRIPWRAHPRSRIAVETGNQRGETVVQWRPRAMTPVVITGVSRGGRSLSWRRRRPALLRCATREPAAA